MVDTIKRRRRVFSRAHHLLEELQSLYIINQEKIPANPRLIATLRSLQDLLIREITRAERKIRRTKEILHGIPMESAEADSAAARLNDYRILKYSWLCFGDAIAYLFMDKYTLKHTYFNIDNPRPKQDSGFIFERSGLKFERSRLEDLLNNGIPSLLCDLTNTIRHGDICIMTTQDPQLIEVKSGGVNNRGRRQLKAIKQLARFFETDVALGLRGHEKIVRVAHQAEEINYTDALNLCVKVATRSGAALCSPEDGLFYVVISRDDIDIGNIIDKMSLVRPAVFFLNEIKSARAWAPYSPFTLSIRNRDALFNFIWGEIFIYVFYETSKLQHMAEAKGLMMTFFDEESDYMFEISIPQSGGVMRISKQFFTRMATEFTSPEWIFQTSLEKIGE